MRCTRTYPEAEADKSVSMQCDPIPDGSFMIRVLLASYRQAQSSDASHRLVNNVDLFLALCGLALDPCL